MLSDEWQLLYKPNEQELGDEGVGWGERGGEGETQSRERGEQVR